MWWLWPHFKRIWTVAGAIAVGLAVNYLYGLLGNQSVPDLERFSHFLWGYWPWAGGALTLFAMVSIFAERAHRRHAAPHFIGEVRGRKRVKLPPLSATTTTASTLIVGREGELAQLRDWYASVLQGERRVVFVSGEAGIGKTTFVNTFIDSLRREGVRIARGQCIEQYGAGEPYMPMLEALTQLGRGAESQQLLAILHRLAPAWLAQLPALLTAEERARIQGETQGLTQQRMLREMAETLAALAADAPLVLLLEDLHWSDASTLDLIAALARRTEPARLLIIGTYRPVEMLAGDHPLRALKEELEVHQQCQEVRLKLLGESEVAAYLKRRFADDGAQYSALAPAIYQRSEGNALFMVNVVDYLVAQGPELDPSKFETPRNIRQMIERNLRRLDTEEQAVLESASVAGAEFSAAAVAAALERPVGEIDACCTRLARNEQFIRSQGENRWPDGTRATSYRFLHALYQEVLYQRTPAGQQDELHRRIAEREEAAWGAGAAELAAELAYHYERCGNQAKAVTYLELAGARAIAQGAYREAEQHYRKALASLETLPVSAERNDIELQIQLALAGCLNSRSFGDPGRARPLTRARALSEQSGDHAQLLRVLWQLCQYNIERMEIRSALEVAEEAFHLAKDSSRPDLIAGAIYNMGEVSFWRGDVKTALEYFERATELIEKHSSIDYSAAYGIALQTELVPSIAAVVAGNPERGVTLIRRLIERSRATKDQFFYSYSLGVSSLISWILRDFAAMRAPIDTATAQAVEYGFSEVEGLGHGMAAALKAAEGDSATALIDWKVAQSVLESVGSFVWARGFAMTAEIYRQTTSEAETLHFIDSCLEQLSQSSAHLPEAELCRIKGETLGAASPSNLAQSEHWLRRAVETSQRQGARWYELRATMSLARLLDHQGRCDEARSMLAEIYNWFTEGFDTADLKDAKALLEELTG